MIIRDELCGDNPKLSSSVAFSHRALRSALNNCARWMECAHLASCDESDGSLFVAATEARNPSRDRAEEGQLATQTGARRVTPNSVCAEIDALVPIAFVVRTPTRRSRFGESCDFGDRQSND